MKITLKEGEVFYCCLCQKFELVKIDKENDTVTIQTKNFENANIEDSTVRTEKEEKLKKYIENMIRQHEATELYNARLASLFI